MKHRWRCDVRSVVGESLVDLWAAHIGGLRWGSDRLRGLDEEASVRRCSSREVVQWSTRAARSGRTGLTETE